ncbi:MAG: hypothetical protein COA57_11630 [Flavobacteriales bacterium]|nr:MAG: hypothetical protein COA57_11630 [Flavobacteriales bacterium]
MQKIGCKLRINSLAPKVISCHSINPDKKLLFINKNLLEKRCFFRIFTPLKWVLSNPFKQVLFLKKLNH